MSRVLLVVPQDAARPLQVQALLSHLGVEIDVLLVGSRIGAQEKLPIGLDLAANLGVAPVEAGQLSNEENAARLDTMLGDMASSDGYRAIFLSGLDLPAGTLPDVPRIYDAADGQVSAWPVRPPELFLAADESLRQHGSHDAGQSARWPLALTPSVASVRPGGPIGWPGSLDGQGAEGWARIAARLVQERLTLPVGLMLDSRVDLPLLVAERRVDPSGYSSAAQLRALSLGVLPETDIGPHLSRIVGLVGLGVPVLTTPAIAERFEGRWRLPVAEDADGFSGWIDGWNEGRDVEQLSRAASETRNAFHDDVIAMQSFVCERVAEVLAVDLTPTPMA